MGSVPYSFFSKGLVLPPFLASEITPYPDVHWIKLENCGPGYRGLNVVVWNLVSEVVTSISKQTPENSKNAPLDSAFTVQEELFRPAERKLLRQYLTSDFSRCVDSFQVQRSLEPIKLEPTVRVYPGVQKIFSNQTLTSHQRNSFLRAASSSQTSARG